MMHHLGTLFFYGCQSLKGKILLLAEHGQVDIDLFHNEENTNRVFDAVTQSPRRSIVKHALPLNLPKSVCKILKVLHFHSYKIPVTSLLTNNHKKQRVESCTALLNLFNNQSEVFDSLLSFDEAHFHLNRLINKQNCCYLAVENP
jgi:hypothetical protein